MPFTVWSEFRDNLTWYQRHQCITLQRYQNKNVGDDAPDTQHWLRGHTPCNNFNDNLQPNHWYYSTSCMNSKVKDLSRFSLWLNLFNGLFLTVLKGPFGVSVSGPVTLQQGLSGFQLLTFACQGDCSGWFLLKSSCFHAVRVTNLILRLKALQTLY